MKVEDIKKWSLEKRVFATLAYFDVFQLALSRPEIEKYLLGDIAEEEKLNEVLKSLIKSKLIAFKDNFYFLEGSKDILPIRTEKSKIALRFKKWAEGNLWIFAWVPFLKQVYLCNNLSFDGVNKKSDIDVFVVTKKNRIFIARTALTLLTHLFRMRRHGNNVAGRFCLSFYVTEEHLNLEHLLLPNFDIYFAYWVIGLLPLVGNIDAVLAENKWINNYFGNVEARVSKKDFEQEKVLIIKLKEYLLGGFWGNFWEKMLGNYFIRRYEKNKLFLDEKSSVIVSERILKYHNLDRRKEFRLAFEKRLKRFDFSG